MAKELEKCLVAEARRLEIEDIYIDRSRPHPRLHGWVKGRRIKYVVMANTPSDHRAIKNTIKVLRNVVREAQQRSSD